MGSGKRTNIILASVLRRESVKKLATWVLPLIFVTSTAAATTTGLPWINDNYAKALAEAKQRKLPIFVECWAPW
jgi:hypothetical protein